MTRPSYDLRGKVVLITGGTGGIGSATARELLRRGAKVAIVDVDPETPRIAARMSSHSAMGAVADVGDRDALDLAVADVVDRFGRVDIAIANAGILSRAATLRTTPTSSIESLFAVNVTGVVNTVQAAMDQVICSPRAIRPHQFGVRVPQRNGHHPLRHEQSGRRATRPRTARGTRDTRRLDDDRLLLTHRNQHDQTRRRRRPHRRRTPRRPCRGPCSNASNPTLPQQHSPTASLHRSPRVMAPARWKPISALRGTHRPRTGSTSGPRPTNPGRPDRTRRANPTPRRDNPTAQTSLQRHPITPKGKI